MAHAQASTATEGRSAIGDVFGPIGKFLGTILYFLGIILLVTILILSAFVGYRYFTAKQETGQLSSTVTHVEVGTEQALSKPNAFLKSKFPDLYAILYPEQFNPYSIDSVVERSANREIIGIKIIEFKPVAEFFRPNSPITLIGKIKAGGLDEPFEIETYCSLDGYEIKEPIPAQLTGLTGSGNKGSIYEDQEVEFNVECSFPKGLKAEKQVTSKKAKLMVVYNFKTIASQKIWFLDKNQLLALQSKSIDPFKTYKISDPLLDSSRKTKSRATQGPINLGLQIDFPQPLTENTKYLVMVQISRSAESGNLEKLNYLTVKVPSTEELDLVLEGEESLLGQSQCDFEYVGQASDPGFKEYRLSDAKVQETNQDCNEKSLKELAISEKECIDVFKNPLFLCNFEAKVVPTKLKSDKIRADAGYTFKVERQAVVDIKALPSELVA